MNSYTLTLLTQLIAGQYPGEVPSTSHLEVCKATIFAQKNGDPWDSGNSAFLRRPVHYTDNGIAHRTLPLGVKVRLCNKRTDKCTRTRVIERGPFGRLTRSGRWYNGAQLYRDKRSARDRIPTGQARKGVEGWRGCVDMTPLVAQRIDHNGLEQVTLQVIDEGYKRRRPTDGK